MDEFVYPDAQVSLFIYPSAMARQPHALLQC
jgi:hypothetical protein